MTREKPILRASLIGLSTDNTWRSSPSNLISPTIKAVSDRTGKLNRLLAKDTATAKSDPLQPCLLFVNLIPPTMFVYMMSYLPHEIPHRFCNTANISNSRDGDKPSTVCLPEKEYLLRQYLWSFSFPSSSF